MIHQSRIEEFLGRGDFAKVDDFLLPNNEGKRKVRNIVLNDLKQSNKTIIVSGYASLDELLKVISLNRTGQELTILIGNEPSIGNLTNHGNSVRQLSDSLKRYWLEEKRISLAHSFTLLKAYRMIEENKIQIRINSSSKKLHAKIILTDHNAMIGSSNFTVPGLSLQRELNSRFHIDESERYNSAKSFVEGCLQQSEDYRDELLELLNKLLRNTTWQEALSCACWDMLEGNETDEVLRNLKLSESNLWPHQIQAISQGVGILREQGSLLVADATGSGKTRTGMWLMAAADSMVKMSQDVGTLQPDPVLVVPKAVEKEWKLNTRRELRRVPEVIGHGKISTNYKSGTEGHEILSRLNDCEVVLVDEAHNFYNDSARTRRLRTHAAQSSILLTATPINRSFEDLLSLVELLSQDDFDEELERKLRNLRKQVYSKDKNQRTIARSAAAKLVQEFTIRRTRFDLNRIAHRNPDRYTQLGRDHPGFPDRNQKRYQLELSTADREKIDLIRKISSEMVGIAFLPKNIRLSKKQRELGFKETSIIKQTLSLAKAGSQYRIWSTLASSHVAAFEHVRGTAEARSVFDIPHFKSTSSDIPNKIKEIGLPKWELDPALKTHDLVPRWLVNEGEFNSKVEEEWHRYDRIGHLLTELEDGMEEARVKLLLDHYNNGDKVLAFDWHLISLERMRKRLVEEGVPADRVHIFSSGNKEKAELHFSLQSDNYAAIGLCSDSLSEGINLQGANVMLNLERPTTVRRFEQRMGRVDRMNSRHDQISVYVPVLPDLIASQLRDHLSERLQLVREVFGGNDIDKKAEEEFGISSLDESFDDTSDHDVVIEDAYSPIRNLIGEDSILSDEEYEAFGMPDVRARSEISILKSDRRWCFFSLKMNWNSSVKWALLTYESGKPVLNTNLDEICKFLTDQFTQEVVPVSNEEDSDEFVRAYFEDLERKRHSLLPKRFKNALKIGMEYFSRVNRRFERESTNEHDRFKLIQQQFGEAFSSEAQHNVLETTISVDKFALADGWLKMTNQHKRNALKKTDRRSNTNTRKSKFLKHLIENGPTLSEFENLINSCPMETNLESDVMIAIAGIPA
jgi:superfamily II DNA or RNA helicase